MTETKRVIDIKKQKLKEAIRLNESPEKIKRLRADIKRHKKWETRRMRTKRNAIQKKNRRK